MKPAAKQRASAPAIDFQVQSPLWDAQPAAEQTMRAAIAAAAERVPADGEMSVVLTDDAAIRALNRDWRSIDKPTNVLSFPAAPVERELGGSLGDLVICAPVVAAEAREQRKARPEHWAHMVVHGVLHLHGYDHETARQARVMEGLEVEILRGFGYQDPYRPVTSPNHER